MEEFLDESFYIARCCHLIEEKLQSGKSKNWRNSDFIRLSELVTKASSISISPDTLKRLFGKIKTYRTYNPQIETKNALAIFLEYKNWEDFKHHHTLLDEVMVKPEPRIQEPVIKDILAEPAGVLPDIPPITTSASRKDKLTKSVILITSIAFLIVALLTGYLLNNNGKDQGQEVSERNIDSKLVKFSGKLLKGTVPHTVVFNYDISKLNADSVYINYGYDYFEYKEIDILPPDLHTITHYYHYPGLYQPRIMYGSKVLASLNVEVLADEWAFNIYTRDKQLKSIDRKVYREHFDEGIAYLTNDQLIESDVVPNRVNWLEMSYIKQIKNTTGDNLLFETRFKNNPEEGGQACLESIFRILGQKHHHRIQFNKPGCSRWSIVEFGELQLDGKYADLSAFTGDLSSWNDLKLEVKNQRVQIFLNERKVFEGSYKEPVGEIKGIIFNFRGLASVDYVRLKNAKGELVFNEEFQE